MYYNDIAVIVHGYNLLCLNLFEKSLAPLNQDWHYLVWGDANDQLLGRASKGILLALRHKAACLIFGTGASWIDDKGRVIARQEFDALDKKERSFFCSEAEFTIRYFLDHFEDLMCFEELADEIKHFKGGLRGAKDFISNIHKVEELSSNTREEINYGLRMCNNFPLIKNICLVSNPSHLLRCAWTASKEMRYYKQYKRFSNILTAACDTDFARDGEEPCIFEPHSGPNQRPDVHPTDIFPYFWLVPPDKRQDFLKKMHLEINNLIP